MCGAAVRPVPGGHGMTTVHTGTGAVAARTPAVVVELRALVDDWQQRASELDAVTDDGDDYATDDGETQAARATVDTYADLATALAAVLDGTA